MCVCCSLEITGILVPVYCSCHTGCLKKMIHFSIGNIFVNPADIAKPNMFII